MAISFDQSLGLHAQALQLRGQRAKVIATNIANQPSIDGNTVDEHQEKTAFADNALRYQASLRFLNSRIKRFMDVLQSE